MSNGEYFHTKPPWAIAHQRIMKIEVGCVLCEDLLSCIRCKGRFLFGGMTPITKLTMVACMHHELLLLF